MQLAQDKSLAQEPYLFTFWAKHDFFLQLVFLSQNIFRFSNW